jgi:hypothetical protein
MGTPSLGGTSPGRKSAENPQAFGQFSLLQFRPPRDKLLWPVAVLLLDPITDKLYIRGLEDYGRIAEEDDALAISLTVKQFAMDAEAQGGNRLLLDLEDKLSNTLRITDRIPLPVRDFETTLDRLFAVFIS